jgi:hypothetical protein
MNTRPIRGASDHVGATRSHGGRRIAPRGSPCSHWPALKMSISFVVLLVACTGSEVAVRAGNGSDLEVDLFFERPSYSLSELGVDPGTPGRVRGKVRFTNRTASPLLLDPWRLEGCYGLPGCLYFSVVAPSGPIFPKQLPNIGHRPPRGLDPCDEFVEVPARGAYELFKDLNRLFDLREKGVYHVHVEYTDRETRECRGKKVWGGGEVRSPIRTFELVQ